MEVGQPQMNVHELIDTTKTLVDGTRACWRWIKGLQPTILFYQMAYELGLYRGQYEVLAHYAALCQEAGLVPIVEQEMLMDVEHTLERRCEVY